MKTSKFTNTKTEGELSFLVFGDVHLGHPQTKADEIVPKLYRLLPDNEATRKLDIIVIEGDLFDQILLYNSEYLAIIKTWMIWLLTKCKKYDITLYVLEGTPSHDMRQPKHFVTYNEAYGINADLHYIDRLHLERSERFGISILFLPDEWDSPLENCYTSAKRLLNDHGLEKADFAVMHGSFDHQLPPNLGIPVHNGDLWQSIVEYYIFVGHVHFYSQKGKIIASGSFDRLKHGEEKPKGYVRAIVRENGRHDLRFVENKEAKVFLTIDCTGCEGESALKVIEAAIEGKPKGSHFRLMGKKDDGIKTARTYMQDRYPDYYWDEPKFTDDAVINKTVLPSIELVYEPIHLTRDNLQTLLTERLKRLGSDTETIKRCMALLKEAM